MLEQQKARLGNYICGTMAWNEWEWNIIEAKVL